MFKIFNLFSFLTDLLIRFFLGLVFFNFGYGKLTSLINGEAENIFKMVESITFFGMAPVFFSWTLALSETFLIIGLIYGTISILPLSSFISKASGLIALIISLTIIYQHIYVWGDNVFSYGPISFLNAAEGKKSIYGQLLFLPLSLYIIFCSRQNLNLNIDNK